ncbi:6-phosphofructo-2-kinase [Sorochytrium milnesiophthora]
MPTYPISSANATPAASPKDSAHPARDFAGLDLNARDASSHNDFAFGEPGSRAPETAAALATSQMLQQRLPHLQLGVPPASTSSPHTQLPPPGFARTMSSAPGVSLGDRGVVKDLLQRKNEVGPKLLIVMVGLPARGKSYICKKVKRYLSWLGFNAAVFNVGNRRRVTASEEAKRDHKAVDHSSQFFDPTNKDAADLRDKLALETLEELITWLNNGGKVAFHDATNTTIARRNLVAQRIRQERNIKVLYMESICTDEAVLRSNIQMKLLSPDYIGMEPTAAIADFTSRMKNYEKAYQPLGDYEDQMGMSYIKVINVGKKVIASNIQGYIASQIVFYLMNIHVKERTIWITRHGESTFNVSGRIGGNPHLTANGRKYADALSRFFNERYLQHSGSSQSVADGQPGSTLSGSSPCASPTVGELTALEHVGPSKPLPPLPPDAAGQRSVEEDTLRSNMVPLAQTKRSRLMSSSVLDWNTDLLEDLDPTSTTTPVLSNVSSPNVGGDRRQESAVVDQVVNSLSATHDSAISFNNNGSNGHEANNDDAVPARSGSPSSLSLSSSGFDGDGACAPPTLSEGGLDDYHDEIGSSDAAAQAQQNEHRQGESKDTDESTPALLQLTVWTSMLARAVETVRRFPKKHYYLRHSKLLNEIYSGF